MRSSSCWFNKWRLTLKYERRFVRVCKHMNAELIGPAKMRTENCPGCEKQQKEKCHGVVCFFKIMIKDKKLTTFLKEYSLPHANFEYSA